MADEIVKEAIVEPVRGTGSPVGLAVVLGGAFAILAMAFASTGSGFMYILIVVFACLFWLLFRVLSQRQRVRSSRKIVEGLGPKARDAMISYIGSKPPYIDASGTIMKDWNPVRACGTGMAYDGRYIYVLDDGEIARIPWSCVRSWQWSIEGHNTIELFTQGVPMALGTSMQIQANNANMTASAAAYRDSGFFVTVADVDKPVWQFRTTDEKVLRRWGEIFAQIKEGRLSVAS